MKAISRVCDICDRITRSALGAAVFAMGASALDATWARAAAGEALRKAGLSIYLADAGLIAPFALCIGLTMGVFGLIVDPTAAPSPFRLVAALRVRAIGRPADIAAFVPLTVLGAFFWTTLAAHLARALLAIEVSPALAGVAIATSVLGLGLLVALSVLVLMPSLRRSLATASDGHPACVDPAVTGGVALLAVAALFTFGVISGGVSGEGGLFGIYGIFKRPELDLRAPALALAVALGGFFAPAVLRRVRSSFALALALLPIVLTARAAGGIDGEKGALQAIERGAPIGRIALSIAKRITDRDGDGASGLFGGGDCNDQNPKVNPLAREIPDNGIDEDCSGADLTAAAIANLAPRPPVAPAKAKMSLPPDLNVVLITVDTLRADLGFAGNPRPVSTNLDKLAAKSTVFERAYSLASYTGKSVGPMLIGKYGSETHRNWGHFNKLTEEDTFVAERLKRASVHTMSVQGHRYFGKFSGLDRGFEELDGSVMPEEGATWSVDTTTTSDKLSDAALALLGAKENTSKRFFLWVHYLDPHADYLPHNDVPSFGSSQRDLYDGEVAFTDKHIGRVLDAIAAAPWGSRTAVIVTSDHGEAFGEHKMFRHGFELWEELVRVPLIIHVPGAAPSRIAVRRSVIDLVPTILELMGVEPPPPPATADESNFLSGASLLPDIFLEPGGTPALRDILMDMPAGPYNDARRALIHGDLKLTISNGTNYELYDLLRDPDEQKDIWDNSPEAKVIEPYYTAAKARLREIRVTGQRK